MFTSEVTQDEAVAFLSGRTNPSKDVKEEDVDEMEALFDDIIWGGFLSKLLASAAVERHAGHGMRPNE